MKFHSYNMKGVTKLLFQKRTILSVWVYDHFPKTKFNKIFISVKKDSAKKKKSAL